MLSLPVYEVRYYAPDGHTRTDGPMPVDGERYRSLADARIAIARALGCQTFGKWSGLEEDGDIEAWHESAEEGCGGYAIRWVKD